MRKLLRVIGVCGLLVNVPLSSGVELSLHTPKSEAQVSRLVNGVVKRNLASRFDQDMWFSIAVPAHVERVKFESFGGTGDADMYVKLGSKPTDDDWDCRPMMAGNSEQCVMTSTGGVYFVRLKSFVGFTAVNLKASFSTVARTIL